MAGAARLLAVLLLTVPLAGCFGGASETAASAEPLDDGGVSGNVSREAMPDGRGGRLVAFEETNATEEGAGGLDHHHDYWQGRERVTIFQGDVRMRTAARTTGATGAFAAPALPPDVLVFEGTASVELTFSNPQRRACNPLIYSGGDQVCSDFGTGTRVPDPDGGPAGIRALVRHAATTSWLEAGEVSWDAPLAFQVTDPRQTDMPHASNTLWAFRFESDDASMGTLTFDLQIDLVRAEGEIPLWPGHPEFYAAGHERVVFQGPLVTRETGMTGVTGAGGEETIERGVPDKLVSYGTRALYVYANITGYEALNPAEAPTGWFLEFHNASGRIRSTDWTHPDHTGAVLEHAWVIEVTDDGMDSPYADGSRWGFWLRGSFSDGTVIGCTGCSSYEARYELTVVATDLPPDREADATA